MPKPFLNKLIVHGAIGFFCVLFGCIYGFITDDQIFLLMSLCIGVGTAIRIVSLLHTIKMHDYTELTGQNVKSAHLPRNRKLFSVPLTRKNITLHSIKISAFYLDIIIAYISGM